jgi:hypothetical protein
MSSRPIRSLLLFAACAGAALPARAQEKLAYMLPTLYGPNGLFVNSEALLPTGQTHSAHFNNAFQSSFGPFNTALATQLAAVPLPSPASGFTYTYDATLGVFNRTTESYGPILSDRAEALGKGRASLGFNYQRFSFDKIEGLSLDAIPVVFTHDNPLAGTGRDDVVTTNNSIGVEMSQFTTSFNYGVTDRVDFSVAIPVVTVDLKVTSLATVRRIGTTNPAVHFFFQPTGDTFGSEATFRRNGRATGVGDILLRLKYEVVKRGSLGIALGVQGRAPTGDEKDLLGSGAPGVKPFLVISSAGKRISPHLKLAYQWNGDSLLAGDLLQGVKGNLADQALFEGGVDIGLGKKLTLAADFIGRRVIDGERLAADDFRALDGRSVFPNVRFFRESYNIFNGSVGLKANPGGNLLVDLNLLFKLNDSGLRDRVTPLFGIEYSF